MKVAVMFSGGKDSTQAVAYCKEQGWDVTLIAVKPSSPEAYVWHYPTVELTNLSAEAMGLPLIFVESNSVGPKEEANDVDKVFSELDVDAIVFGGVGLQKTQIREVGAIAKKHGINVLVPYENLTSEELLDIELDSGLAIIIADVASGGLGPEWIGRKLDEQAIQELKALAKKHGFDPLGEGGSYNTFVVDAPFFNKKIEIVNAEKTWDPKYRAGELKVHEAKLVPKAKVLA